MHIFFLELRMSKPFGLKLQLEKRLVCGICIFACVCTRCWYVYLFERKWQSLYFANFLFGAIFDIFIHFSPIFYHTSNCISSQNQRCCDIYLRLDSQWQYNTVCVVPTSQNRLHYFSLSVFTNSKLRGPKQKNWGEKMSLKGIVRHFGIYSYFLVFSPRVRLIQLSGRCRGRAWRQGQVAKDFVTARNCPYNHNLPFFYASVIV